MEHKIAIIPTCIVFLILIALIVIVVACPPKSTKVESKPTEVEAETSHAESYELYVLDNFSNGETRLTLYNTYKVKPENINTTSDIITTYNATDGTQIIFANNGVTVISPKGYKESFTEGYMRRK